MEDHPRGSYELGIFNTRGYFRYRAPSPAYLSILASLSGIPIAFLLRDLLPFPLTVFICFGLRGSRD